MTVACPAPVADLVRIYGVAWANRQGATLDVRTYEPAAGPESVAGADVWVLPASEVPRRAAAGKLERVPEELTLESGPYAWTRLLPLYREKLLRWGDTPVALPVAGEMPLLLYRSDKLSDPAAKEAFAKKHGRPLAPPATWEEFADVAEFFAKDGPSLPPLSASDDGLDREFFTLAAGYARRAVPGDEQYLKERDDDYFSFAYDLRSGKPRLTQPGFVYALGLMQRLQKCRPAGPSPEPERAFLDGQAVLCLADLGVLAKAQAGPLRDKVGVRAVPAAGRYFRYADGVEVPATGGNRVPYLGASSWLAVVPKDAPRPGMGWALLADLTGPETAEKVVLEARWGAGPTRSEHLDRNRWAAYDLSADVTKSLRDMVPLTMTAREVQNPAIRLRTPAASERQATLANELRKALAHSAVKPADALAAVAGKWQEADAALGADRARTDYQISVGRQVRKEE